MDRRVVYCHGLPGCPTELGAFGAATRLQHIRPLHRLAHSRGNFEADLLAAFDALEIKEPSVVVGFSLGAMSAIHLAARRAHLQARRHRRGLAGSQCHDQRDRGLGPEKPALRQDLLLRRRAALPPELGARARRPGVPDGRTRDRAALAEGGGARGVRAPTPSGRGLTLGRDDESPVGRGFLQRAGDRDRTGDVQLGKLAFYR